MLAAFSVISKYLKKIGAALFRMLIGTTVIGVTMALVFGLTWIIRRNTVLQEILIYGLLGLLIIILPVFLYGLGAGFLNKDKYR